MLSVGVEDWRLGFYEEKLLVENSILLEHSTTCCSYLFCNPYSCEIWYLVILCRSGC